MDPLNCQLCTFHLTPTIPRKWSIYDSLCVIVDKTIVSVWAQARNQELVVLLVFAPATKRKQFPWILALVGAVEGFFLVEDGDDVDSDVRDGQFIPTLQIRLIVEILCKPKASWNVPTLQIVSHNIKTDLNSKVFGLDGVLAFSWVF